MIRIAALQEQYHRYKSYILIILLVIFYTVGVFGLASEKRDEFLRLTSLNLSVSFIILVLARIRHSVKFYTFLFIAFFLGMTAEWIGIHTGKLFGNYIYGENLGLKWHGVPVIIGLNWAMLTIITASCMQFFRIHFILKILGAAALMLVLDLLIEPVAIKSDYWIWHGDIPVSNFIDWFIVALVLQVIYFRSNLAEPNKVAVSLYMIQLAFFAILNLI
ncbi:MAG: carotenoid biosynthesis protein [Brumimicrobium sp.]|nr:carotenoid biosynthesis protein [Brumimicrobium sp.]